MNNNSFDSQGDQFVLSRELVQVMDWIVRHNPEGMRKVIEIAITKAKSERRMKKENKDFYDSYFEDDLQDSIIDFFGLLEKTITDIENETSSESLVQKQLLPSIEHVDTSACDELTVSNCAYAAATKIKKQPEKDAKELFLKELLKQWKPNKRNKN